MDHGLYTQLSNKFRYDYADFWLAIINRDVEAIKTAADSLGVGKKIQILMLDLVLINIMLCRQPLRPLCLHGHRQIMELDTEGTGCGSQDFFRGRFITYHARGTVINLLIPER